MLNEHEWRVLDRARAFAQGPVHAEAAGWSMGQVPSPGLWESAAQQGLTGIEVPEAKGGLGLGFVAKAALCEALAGADFGFAMSVINTHNVALKLSQCGTEQVQHAYLPKLLSGEWHACTALTEPSAGSDFAAIQTRALKRADHWVLDGEKTWIINARYASLAIVYAQCAEPGDRLGIGAFLVDLRNPGCLRYALDSAVSQTSMGTGGFALRDCQIPLDHCLIAPGQAFHAILSEINGARAYVAAMCVGMLDAALRCAQAYGQRRETFGQRLDQHQAWRLGMARAQTDLAAMRALVGQAAQAVQNQEDAQLLCAQAKVFAVQVCREHLPKLLHALGAHGLQPTHVLARHAAAISMAGLTDGSDEMLLERIAHLTRPAPISARGAI
jgi:alkylation response protein AidB-like acyl-CoA dehydrogenase